MSKEEESTSGHTKILWVKRRFLEEILQGRKTVEVRVGYKNIQRLRPNMQLLLNETHEVTIRDVRRYRSFSELLENESADSIAPGMSKEELLKTFHLLYPPYKEKLGVFALEIEM